MRPSEQQRPVLMATLDAHGRFTFVNQAWYEALGWCLEQARGSDIFPCFTPRNDAEGLGRLIESAACEWREFDVITHTGAALRTVWAAVPLPGGSRVLVGLDVTRSLEARAAPRHQFRRDPLPAGRRPAHQ